MRRQPSFISTCLIRLAAVALILGAALSTALLTPHVALAWANGGDYGNGFGTHDWVLHEADRLAASRGYDWLRLGSALRATDNPDTRLQDTYHHVYDVWGARYGDAPDRCQELFARAAAQLRAGDAAAASRTFGLLSHYYADICNPTHTDSRDREARMHAATRAPPRRAPTRRARTAPGCASTASTSGVGRSVQRPERPPSPTAST